MGKGISNDLVVLVVGVVLFTAIFKIPSDVSWLGEFLIGGVSGLVGYLTGKGGE